MTSRPNQRVLYVVVCGAGPAPYVDRLIKQAQQRGWQVCVLATPAALEFIDAAHLEALTGYPVRSHHRKPGEPRGRGLPRADAIVVAPATYNTINKWAAGIADTYPLDVLAECTGLGLPIVVLPFVNAALAANRVFARSIQELRAAGIRVIHGPGQIEPHPPGTGSRLVDTFPWHLALDHLDQHAHGPGA
ncbi:flavoprotein [Carbonactinospora thermoautotrophica]|uniref:flavoprotein n=1 Tax=Carbonactinospora thermoautotrophica TaxID=1469144 RepID=UPI00226FD922|nr:flavoprotein [Carbonactinospora thermoautotrophica]MCX9193196.1 flavoprotein [Carbonactinospora thermoautotrophica]